MLNALFGFICLFSPQSKKYEPLTKVRHEHKGSTGECWAEVMAVQTSLCSVHTKMTEGQYSLLLYGCVSQGLGTTEFTNLIG